LPGMLIYGGCPCAHYTDCPFYEASKAGEDHRLDLNTKGMLRHHYGKSPFPQFGLGLALIPPERVVQLMNTGYEREDRWKRLPVRPEIAADPAYWRMGEAYIPPQAKKKGKRGKGAAEDELPRPDTLSQIKRDMRTPSQRAMDAAQEEAEKAAKEREVLVEMAQRMAMRTEGARASMRADRIKHNTRRLSESRKSLPRDVTPSEPDSQELEKTVSSVQEEWVSSKGSEGQEVEQSPEDEAGEAADGAAAEEAVGPEELQFEVPMSMESEDYKDK